MSNRNNNQREIPLPTIHGEIRNILYRGMERPRPSNVEPPRPSNEPERKDYLDYAEALKRFS